MADTVHTDYEVSSTGAVRHWIVPYASMENTTPVETNPAAVLSAIPGTQLTGTILTIDDDADIAVVDFTCSMVYRHDVRNVITYAVGAEATFRAINIGDPVYYDRSATMPTGVHLSTSPLDSTGAANPLYGYVVPSDDSDAALYPLGGATASTQRCAIMQRGAGA